ncbi:family 1 glycosylhydrolase [Virgibacillus oceani]|uniref:6-phospho-beta-glucosidase n=1 Tax=Virgibacillus oceani TaxID=1479511 RepID=A0A917M5A2_9BACI|nr:family 1 glycosylhydrolase [Virgibacillus oceani]GGG79781.1 hypothetical protein GCM10011398_26380 [Virgibacillus oceani]
MIVGNGYGGHDDYVDGKVIEDPGRVRYLNQHLLNLEEAIKDGCEILGYTWWGPIDIVSAGTGEMRKRYGFIYGDKDNKGNGILDRVKKPSFDWYQKIIETNDAVLHDEEALEDVREKYEEQ